MGNTTSSSLCPTEQQSINNKNNKNFVDLQEFVRTWACDELNRNPIPRKGICSIVHKFLKNSELNLAILWDELQITQGQTVYEDFDDAGHSASSQILMKAHFSNNSHVEQLQNFTGTKTMECGLKVNLEKTLCVGNETKLRLLLPEEIIAETNEFGRQVCITDKSGYEDKKDVDWRVDHPVKVPAYSSISAEYVVMEREVSAWFTIPVTVSGNVNVVISEAKSGNLLKVLEGNIASIVNFNMDEGPIVEENSMYGYTHIYSTFSSLSTSRLGLNWDVANGEISYEANGCCRFRYGVEEMVKLGGQSQL